MRISALRTVMMAMIAFQVVLVSPSLARDVYADRPPPEPKAERVPGPRDGYFWGQGHWAWSGKSWFWVNGTWVIQRRGMNWVPDHWEPDGERWHFVPAHWDRG